MFAGIETNFSANIRYIWLYLENQRAIDSTGFNDCI